MNKNHSRAFFMSIKAALKNEVLMSVMGTNRCAAFMAKSIPLLFGLLIVLQALDFHSTLLGIANREEQNLLITWLAMYIGFTQALLIMKVVAGGILYYLFLFWRESAAQFDTAYASCLIFLATVNGSVVANNYMG